MFVEKSEHDIRFSYHFLLELTTFDESKCLNTWMDRVDYCWLYGGEK